MKRIAVLLLFSGTLAAFCANDDVLTGSERVKAVRQDISKFDKNGDGQLTGAERDEFVKAKRKEAADAENARRSAKLKAKPPRRVRPRPALSVDMVHQPVSSGVPKNIEEAQR